MPITGRTFRSDLPAYRKDLHSDPSSVRPVLSRDQPDPPVWNARRQYQRPAAQLGQDERLAVMAQQAKSAETCNLLDPVGRRWGTKPPAHTVRQSKQLQLRSRQTDTPLPLCHSPPQSPSRGTGRTTFVAKPVTLATQVTRPAKLAGNFSRVARFRKEPCLRFLDHPVGSLRSDGCEEVSVEKSQLIIPSWHRLPDAVRQNWCQDGACRAVQSVVQLSDGFDLESIETILASGVLRLASAKNLGRGPRRTDSW